MISNISYEYLEIDDLALLGREFSGLNITVPYKEEIIPYLDIVDEHALSIGSVNTVVNNNGILKGYNTDYYGFYELLKKNDVEIKDKNILIIGTGGSSKTVTKVLNDLLAGAIEYSSRSNGIRIEDVKDKYDVIINTTPVGMYPNDELILDLQGFKLEAAIDLVYNPLRTRFLLSSNTKSISGLYMLVAQAVKAQELFLDLELENKIEEVYKELYLNLVNIVLIGMPMSGKSTLGKQLAVSFNKEFIDTDTLIEESGSIDELIKDIDDFRLIESNVIKSLQHENNKIIATGGGAILNSENMSVLKQNGVIVYLKRSLDYLKNQSFEDRPLINSVDELEILYNSRVGLYEKYADITTNDAVKEEIYEYFSSKWS